MTHPWSRLRQRVDIAARYLDGEGGAEAVTGRRLRVALERAEETLTGRGLWEAFHPDESSLFEELPEAEQATFNAAADRLRGHT